MSRIVMLAGPHAIGKTTTCEKVAKECGFELVPSIAAEYAKEVGYNLNDNPSKEATLEYQSGLLERLWPVYDKALDKDSIFDRSPLDGLAYATMQIFGTTNTALVYDLGIYIAKCVAAVDAYCDVLFIPESDLTLPYADKDNRPSFSEEQVAYRKNYMEILKAASQYLVMTKVVFIPEDKQYDDRVAFIKDYLNDAH